MAHAAAKIFGGGCCVMWRHFDILHNMNTEKKNRDGGYVCVVCIKQVPDTKKVTGEAMKADGTINRAALPAIFNPEDRNALEAALSVKEAYGGKVVAIAMGLPAACAILREARTRRISSPTARPQVATPSRQATSFRRP